MGSLLSNPTPIRAFEIRSDGHTGGGLVVLNDGSVLAAFGDSGDAGEDGRSYAQDPTNHLAKIVRINPADGSATVLAMGVRNVQRLVIDPNGGDPRLNFVDLGGFIAEEIHSVRVADLLGASSPLNFGWGRNADGKAREGTFYIDVTGSAVGAAPTPNLDLSNPLPNSAVKARHSSRCPVRSVARPHSRRSEPSSETCRWLGLRHDWAVVASRAACVCGEPG